MIPILTHPLALFALLSVPALVVIYRLHRRVQRRVVVSTFLLWSLENDSSEQGQKLHSYRFPLSFIMELLILLLLCAAAVGPQCSFQQSKRPIIVVLDDSFSMTAVRGESARQKALDVLSREVKRGRASFVRLVLAGAKPQVLGGYIRSVARLRDTLKGWKCRGSVANLSLAIGFANQMAGKNGRILVVSDQLPPKLFGEGRLRWFSVGRRQANVAIINASRSRLDSKEFVLLSVVNHSMQAQKTVLRIQLGQKKGIFRTFRLSLQPKQVKRLSFSLPKGAPVLYATLPKDALEVDNQVILLPQQMPLVRIKLAFSDPELQKDLRFLLASTKKTILVQSNPDIVLTDKAKQVRPDSKAWIVEFVSGSKATKSYAGPYTLQSEHPLARGLSMKGVVWSAGEGARMPGLPVLVVGSVPLLAVSETFSGGKHIKINLLRNMSNLSKTPNWPILFWNLLAWKEQTFPGFEERNVRLGSQAILRSLREGRALTVLPPEESAYKLKQSRGRIPIGANSVGVFKVKASGQVFSFAANALSQSESDLTRLGSGDWGVWASSPLTQKQQKDMSWLFALLALLAMLAHIYAMTNQKRYTQ